jgi:CBS domain-containing protein
MSFEPLVAELMTARELLSAGELARVRSAIRKDVLTVTPEMPAHQAAYLLVRHQIGCLPVVSDEGLLVGIITESDFVRAAHVLLGGRALLEDLRC